MQNFTEAVLAKSPYTIAANAARDVLLEHQRQLFGAARSFTGRYAPHVLIDHVEDDEGLASVKQPSMAGAGRR